MPSCKSSSRNNHFLKSAKLVMASKSEPPPRFVSHPSERSKTDGAPASANRLDARQHFSCTRKYEILSNSIEGLGPSPGKSPYRNVALKLLRGICTFRKSHFSGGIEHKRWKCSFWMVIWNCALAHLRTTLFITNSRQDYSR